MITDAQLDPKLLTVDIEVEPHTRSADDGNPDRPGAFLISSHIGDDAILEQIRQGDAQFYDDEDVEDYDLDDEPGWRYPIESLRILVQNGYQLELLGETVAAIEQLDGMFTATAKRARRDRQNARHAQWVKDIHAEIEVDNKKAEEYRTWQAVMLWNTVKTFALDDMGDDGITWSRLAHFDGPGSWITTGDTWYVAEVDGNLVYKCHYGNAIAAYARQSIVDEWCEKNWQHRVEVLCDGRADLAARHVLMLSIHDLVGSDVAKRLIALYGAAHFIGLATETEWLVYGNARSEWAEKAAALYGATCTVVETVNADTYTHRAYMPGTTRLIDAYGRHPDGRIIAFAFNNYAVLMIEQVPAALRHLF